MSSQPNMQSSKYYHLVISIVWHVLITSHPTYSRTQLTKDVNSHYSHSEPQWSIQLLITHIKIPNKMRNLPLLLSSLDQDYNFPLLTLEALAKCTSGTIMQRYLSLHSYPSIHYFIMIIYQSTITSLCIFMINEHTNTSRPHHHMYHNTMTSYNPHHYI